MSAGLAQCAVPTSIHCDHLIQAFDGAESDLKVCKFGFTCSTDVENFDSGQLLAIKRSLTSCKALHKNMESNFGDPVLASYIKLCWRIMQHLECLCASTFTNGSEAYSITIP